MTKDSIRARTGDEPRHSGFRAFWMGAVVLATASILANPALAVTKSAFSATLVFGGEEEGPGDCDRFWFDEEGILHLRGCRQSGAMAGDIEGDVAVILDIDILEFDPVEGEPSDASVRIRGTVTEPGAPEASYRFSIDAAIEDGVVSGSFVLHGLGLSKGTHAMGSIDGATDAPVAMIGMMLSR